MHLTHKYSIKVMVFNATFNNISLISWRTVLFVEDTEVPGENHRHTASHWQTFHIMLYWVNLAWAGFKLTKLVIVYVVINPIDIRSWLRRTFKQI